MRISVPTIILCVLMLYGPCRAFDPFASSGYAEGGAAYLDIPAHAYSAGLSNAVTAWRPGLAGIQYNPSILDNAQGYSVVGSFAFLTDDRQFQAVDAVVPVGSYCVTDLSVVNAGVANMERRGDDGILDATSPYFNDQENAVAVAAAGRLPWNLAVGARGRYLYQKIDNENASGMGFDAGATWEPDAHVCVGASVLNIGSHLWWNTGTADDILTEGRVGVAGLFLKKQLVAELDVIKTWHQPEAIAFGLQYTLFDILSVRGGATSSVNTNTWERRDPDYSLGLGIRWSFFGFDYAITIPTGETDLISHKVSLVLNFPRDLFN